MVGRGGDASKGCKSMAVSGPAVEGPWLALEVGRSCPHFLDLEISCICF